MNTKNTIKCFASTMLVSGTITTYAALNGIGPATNFLLGMLLGFTLMPIAMLRWPIYE